MDYRIIEGDCIEGMRRLEGQSVHCVVTSPPYFGLRDYGHDGQIGLEQTPDEYVAKMVEVFREVRRVLRDDGTLWLNLGDSYAATGGKVQPHRDSSGGIGNKGTRGEQGYHAAGGGFIRPDTARDGLKPKDLIGIPWRVAFALQADGWYLRSDIIWHKPNPMPESVTDRPTKSHEYIFLLSRRPSYFYDAEAVKEDSVDPARSAARYSKRNRHSVWTVATAPYKGAHFATFPPELIRPCIRAGTSTAGACVSCGAPRKRDVERWRTHNGVRRDDIGAWRNTDPGSPIGAQGDGHWRYASVTETLGWSPLCGCGSGATACTVIDPFCGSGTTGQVCAEEGRDFIGIELNPSYVRLAEERISRVNVPLIPRSEAGALLPRSIPPTSLPERKDRVVEDEMKGEAEAGERPPAFG